MEKNYKRLAKLIKAGKTSTDPVFKKFADDDEEKAQKKMEAE